jgi:hypothetical protein
MKTTALRRSLCTALSVLAASLASCSKSGEEPRKDPSPPPSAAPVVASASASAAAAHEPAKAALPTLVPEAYEPAKGMDLYPIEGALMVASGLRVGRIAGDAIEWIGSVPDTNQWLGGSQINSVHGTWPDGVDVLYSSNNGRASQPTIFPLTGPKGAAVTFAPGGGLGWYAGSARLGKTTIVGGYDIGGGYRIETIRGPGLVMKPIKASKAGCTEEELTRQLNREDAIAVSFRALAATEKGTLVTIGNLCDRDGSPAAEVWDQPGKSRIVELKEWIKSVGYFAQILRGKGDELFLDSHPVLRYHDGAFAPLPKLDWPLWNLFVSKDGKLHGISGRTIHRYDDGKWTPVAQLPYRMSFRAIAMDEQGTIWVSHDGVSRLRPSKDADLENGCKTPFVYLYDVSWKNDAKYTYPSTRKALSTFPAVADVTLMEYWEGRRSLGVKVKTKEQGEAVVAHIRANMKGEYPELTCYDPKRNVRVIDMNAK